MHPFKASKPAIALVVDRYSRAVLGFHVFNPTTRDNRISNVTRPLLAMSSCALELDVTELDIAILDSPKSHLNWATKSGPTGGKGE